MASVSSTTSSCPTLGLDFNLKDRVESHIKITTNTTNNTLTTQHQHHHSIPNTNLGARSKIIPQVYELDDPIYGKVSIDSPCAIEIVHLPEFLRLKAVLQHGITALIGVLPSPPVNRFDHSLGAMVLVKHLGGTEEAQLAALLHDVSHTALSHVTDLVFGYVIHEVEKEEYLKSTRIPQVLEKYGFDPQRVFDETLFPLLELPSPLICADRLDYALRDSVSFGFLDLEDAREIFRSTVSIDGRMAIDSVRSARLLADAYLKSDQQVWAHGAHSYLYKLAAKAIELSIVHGSITKQSLWTHGDQEFWNLLVCNATPEIMRIVDQINPRCQLFETLGTEASSAEQPALQEIGLENSDDSDPSSRFRRSGRRSSSGPTTTTTIKLRVRSIDPPVKTPSGVQPLSVLDPAFGRRRFEYVHSRESPITFVIRYSPSETSSC